MLTQGLLCWSSYRVLRSSLSGFSSTRVTPCCIVFCFVLFFYTLRPSTANKNFRQPGNCIVDVHGFPGVQVDQPPVNQLILACPPVSGLFTRIPLGPARLGILTPPPELVSHPICNGSPVCESNEKPLLPRRFPSKTGGLGIHGSLCQIAASPQPTTLHFPTNQF